MDNSLMAQFVSFIDSVLYQKEVVSAVSFPVLLIPASVSQILYVNICEFVTSCTTSVYTNSNVLNKLSLLPQ